MLYAALAGCASTSQPQEAKMSFAETKQMIVASKDRFWKDSASIKNARIGATSACIAFGDCVCVESNAKNSFGGYTGLTTETVVYSGRQMTDLRKPKDLEFCTIVEDFPELNGGYIPPSTNPSPALSKQIKSGTSRN